jgi:magnesium-protoporphyrin IX monomethyl ester (oxidative) cyclase
MERLFRIQCGIDRAKLRGGLIGKLQAGRLGRGRCRHVRRLYMLPVNRHALPTQVRVAPAW